jgi:hypothetical protein
MNTDRERLLEEQVVLLQTEVNALQETVAHLLQVQVQQQEAAQGGTKQDSSTIPPATKRSRYACISAKILLQFQPSIDPLDIPYEQIAWWKDIFSYIQPNDYERLHLRRLCNMFKAALKAPPKGMFTVYPHPNHTSIDSLFDRLNALHSVVPHLAATIVFIQEGSHEVRGQEVVVNEYLTEIHRYLELEYPMKIIGAGQDKTFIQNGGFQIFAQKGDNEEKKMELKGMTVREGGHGLCTSLTSTPFVCDSMTFTQCTGTGVHTKNTDGRLINCVITECGQSGIYCENGLIELEGSQTKVHGNVITELLDGSFYGLMTYDTSSSIRLLFPLTKEAVSANNYGGMNYGCRHPGAGGIVEDTIRTVESFE